MKRSMKKPKTMRIFKTKQSSITMKIQKKIKKLQTLRTKVSKFFLISRLVNDDGTSEVDQGDDSNID